MADATLFDDDDPFLARAPERATARDFFGSKNRRSTTVTRHVPNSVIRSRLENDGD